MLDKIVDIVDKLVFSLSTGGKREQRQKEGKEERENERDRGPSQVLADHHHFQDLQLDSSRIRLLQAPTGPAVFCQSSAPQVSGLRTPAPPPVFQNSHPRGLSLRPAG